MPVPDLITIKYWPEVLFGSTITCWFQPGANTSSVTLVCTGQNGTTSNIPVSDFKPETIRFFNLIPGSNYSCSITPHNSDGDGTTINYNPVIMGNLTTAVQNLAATITNNDVTLSWNFPTSDGLNPIGWYGITTSNTGFRSNVLSHISTHRMFGVADSNYTFGVQAVNYAGWGPTTFVSAFGTIPVPTALWLDASSAGNFVLNGSQITQWTDNSGNGNHATQSAGSLCPTLSGTSVVCDGNQWFNANLDFLANVEHTAFFVVKPINNFANLYGAATGGEGSRSLHVGFASSSSYRMNYWANDFGTATTSNFRSGQFNLITYEWKPSVSKTIYANGGLEGQQLSQAGQIGTMAGGGRILNVVAQGIMQCEFKEIVIIITPYVTSLNRVAVENVLMNKWGITPA